MHIVQLNYLASPWPLQAGFTDKWLNMKIHIKR